jgi:hypothetical protein
VRIQISNIRLAERIRKDVRNIDALAADIRENGLICPIAVMPRGGEYQLLAGLRRLRAMELNGEAEIEANIIPAADAEAALKIEHSENEQREPFTYSEKMDYARLIEEIEKAKAAERKAAGKSDHDIDHETLGSHGRGPQTRDIVGEKIGMCGTQYDRAKYVAANATPEMIEQIDRKERSVRKTYDELRAKEKSAAPPVPVVSTPAPPPAPPASEPRVNPADYERVCTELNELTKKYGEMVGKYAAADHKREAIETLLRNTNLQWECDRQGKNGRIAELAAALEAAYAKIAELEAALAAALKTKQGDEELS